MTDDVKKPKFEIVGEEEPVSIPKPPAFDLSKFKSKRTATVANVETLQANYAHHSIAAAKDFVRLHPDEDAYWSDELCFVYVPIKGQKGNTLHLIDEDLAAKYLPSGKILRFRLALAAKPDGGFFLCHVPTRNADNAWNVSAVAACEMAKSRWTQVTSRKEEGIEGYKRDFAVDDDAFTPPAWPQQTLDEMIVRTFAGFTIETDDSPALLRLIGRKQELS